MSGFVLGSLSTIWPWKKEIFDPILKDRNGENLIVGYQRYLPEVWTDKDFIVLITMVIGLISIIAVEKVANKFNK